MKLTFGKGKIETLLVEWHCQDCCDALQLRFDRWITIIRPTQSLLTSNILEILQTETTKYNLISYIGTELYY